MRCGVGTDKSVALFVRKSVALCDATALLHYYSVVTTPSLVEVWRFCLYKTRRVTKKVSVRNECSWLVRISLGDVGINLLPENRVCLRNGFRLLRVASLAGF